MSPKTSWSSLFSVSTLNQGTLNHWRVFVVPFAPAIRAVVHSSIFSSDTLLVSSIGLFPCWLFSRTIDQIGFCMNHNANVFLPRVAQENGWRYFENDSPSVAGKSMSEISEKAMQKSIFFWPHNCWNVEDQLKRSENEHSTCFFDVRFVELAEQSSEINLCYLFESTIPQHVENVDWLLLRKRLIKTRLRNAIVEILHISFR